MLTSRNLFVHFVASFLFTLLVFTSFPCATAVAGIRCNLPGGIQSGDPKRGKFLKRVASAGKKFVGSDTRSEGELRLYIAVQKEKPVSKETSLVRAASALYKTNLTTYYAVCCDAQLDVFGHRSMTSSRTIPIPDIAEIFLTLKTEKVNFDPARLRRELIRKHPNAAGSGSLRHRLRSLEAYERRYLGDENLSEKANAEDFLAKARQMRTEDLVAELLARDETAKKAAEYLSKSSIYIHSNFVRENRYGQHATKLELSPDEILNLDKVLFNIVAPGETHFVDFHPKLMGIRKHAHRMSFKIEDPNLLREVAPEFAREVLSLASRQRVWRAGPARANRIKYAQSFLKRSGMRSELLVEKRAAQSKAFRLHSTEKVELFAVNPLPEGWEIHLGRESVRISREMIQRVKYGTAFDFSAAFPEHPLTRLMDRHRGKTLLLYTKEAAGKSEREQISDIAFVLQRAFPETRVFRDPFSKKTVSVAEHLSELVINNAEDIVTVISGRSEGVTDWNVAQNVRPELLENGFKHTYVLGDGETLPEWDQGSGKAVIVVTGHIDAQLAAFLDEVGKEGYFKGNFVLLNTCRSTVTHDISSKIINEYDGLAVMNYDDRIRPADVERMLFDVIDRVTEAGIEHFSDYLRDVLRRYGLSGVWTLCFDTNHFGGLQTNGQLAFS